MLCNTHRPLVIGTLVGRVSVVNPTVGTHTYYNIAKYCNTVPAHASMDTVCCNTYTCTGSGFDDTAALLALSLLQ